MFLDSLVNRTFIFTHGKKNHFLMDRLSFRAGPNHVLEQQKAFQVGRLSIRLDSIPYARLSRPLTPPFTCVHHGQSST